MNEEMERDDLRVVAQEPMSVQQTNAGQESVPEMLEPVLTEPQLEPLEPMFFIKPVRKVFSRIGLALCTILVASYAAQRLMVCVPMWIWGPDNWLRTSSWGMWITMLVPMYFVAMPLCILIMRGMPAEKPQDAKLGAGNFLIFFCIFYFFTYAGNIFGTILSGLLSGGTARNQISELAMDNNPLKILVIVIMAPLLEEYICRKLIIDRTRRYGEKIAVVLSGLTFGLLHGNLFQFFYAFAGGMVMAYIYIRTGRLRYSVLIHVIMNFMGSVIAPLILTSFDMELLQSINTTMPTEEVMALCQQILPGLMVMLGYSLLLIGLSITGLVFFILKCRKLVWLPAKEQLPKGKCFKTVYLNVGMILFILLCLTSMVSSLFNGGVSKVFSDNDMQITLTSQFQKVEDDRHTVCYLSPDVAVFGNKETFANHPGISIYSETKYANTIIQNNGLQDTTQVKQIQGMTCFEFDDVYTENDGSEQVVYEYHYLAVVYKTPHSHWVLYFATEKSEFESFRETIIQWAKSVEFK